jgi:hypothetical protein
MAGSCPADLTVEQAWAMTVNQLQRYARDCNYSSITRLSDKTSLIRAILHFQR